MQEMHMESIFYNFKIGEPCCLHHPAVDLYGRITGALPSSEVVPDGEGGLMHSQLFFTTPGKSTMLTGKVYLSIPDDIDEKIAHHEQTAENPPLYDGIIELIDGAWTAVKKLDVQNGKIIETAIITSR